LACPRIEHLRSLAFRTWGWTFALTGNIIENLWWSALWPWCRAFTLASIGVESLVTWTADHFWTLALAGPVIEHLCRSALQSWTGTFTLTSK